MLAYLLIRTKHGKSRIALDKLLKHPEFIEVHSVFGRYDLVCMLEVEDNTTLKTFLQNKVWIIEEIDKVETLIVSDTELAHNSTHEDDEDFE